MAISISTAGREGRRSSIILLSLLAMTLIVGGAGGLIAYAWQAVDREAANRETVLVRRALERTLARVGQETTSAAEWDDAYEHTARGDVAWIDQYLGAYYRESFGHDVTLVFDAAGHVIYAARQGHRVGAGAARDLAASAAPLVRSVQSEELRRRAALDRSRPADVSSLAWRTAVLEAGSDIHLVGVSAILPSRRLLAGAHPTLSVVTGRKVNERFLRELDRDLGIEGSRLVRGPDAPAGRATAPLMDSAGHKLAALVWRPAKPGVDVIQHAARPILAVLALLGVTCALLASRIRRLLQGLSAKDRALQASLVDLMEARDEAQAASVAKSRFIANISHEIRTPLNGVLGMAQARANDELAPRQRERLDVVRQSGETLLAVLNDVLDLSKIEAGKLELEMVDFDLSGLAMGAHAAFTALADRKGVDFSLTLAPDALGRYRSDSTRIRQILYNLISNALKFTEAGQVEVAVSRAGEGLVFEVRDTGVGMTEEEVGRLFRSFEQADASTTRRFGGTGLGLAICRELAQRLGGAISVQSAPGRGSVFRLELPMPRLGDEAGPPPDREAAIAGPAPAPERPLRVLAAEDNPVNQLVLKTLLHQVGIEPEVVADGEQALQAWRRGPWDLILMDVQMPVLDGPAAARQIRLEEQATARPRTPIIALTANAMSHQVADYLASGMDAYVAKPIDAGALLETMSNALAEAEDSPPALANEPA